MFKLVVVAGPLRGQEFLLKNDQENIVGKDSGNDAVINLPGVSHKHFSIKPMGNTAYIKDLGSVNGTIVNGKVVLGATVENKDKIVLPDCILQVVFLKENVKIVTKKAGEAEEVEEDYYLKPPPMPKALPQRIIHIFRYRLMPFIHGMNQEYQWKVMMAIFLVVFIVINISLTIFPVLYDSKQVLLIESVKRGVHFAQEIGRMNARALEQKNLDRVDTAFLENEDGVSSYELFDLDGRIVRPIGKLNSYISDPFSIKARDWVKTDTSGKNEFVQILGEGEIGVSAKINAYNAKLGIFEPVGIIAIRFAPKSLAMEATKNSRAYLESLITSILAGVVFFGIVYFLTLRPIDELTYQLEQGIRGKVRTIEGKYLMDELSNLRNVINNLLQKNRELSSDKSEFGSMAEAEEDGPYVVHLQEFLKGSGVATMILDSQKNFKHSNEKGEDLIGIRENVSAGVNILDCSPQKGFAATVIELCDNSANNQAACQSAEYEISGKPSTIYVNCLIGKDGYAKAFYITVIPI